jgi:hypothetical protein
MPSDHSPLVQRLYARSSNRNTERRLTRSDQPSADLCVVDRRIYAIGSEGEINRRPVDVPWLKPTPGKFVNLRDDREHQCWDVVELRLRQNLTC